MKKICFVCVACLLGAIIGCASMVRPYKYYSSGVDGLMSVVEYGEIEILVPSEYQSEKVEVCLSAGGFIDDLRYREGKTIEEILKLLREAFEGKQLFQITDERAEHNAFTIVDQEYYNANFTKVEIDVIIKKYFSGREPSYNGNYNKFTGASLSQKEIISLIKYLIMNGFEVSTGSFSGGYDVNDLRHKGRLDIRN